MAQRFFEDKSITEPYAQFRPTPPKQLAECIVNYLKEKYTGNLSLAVDVGCGSGQATVLFGLYFENVLGTDVSPEQIKLGNAREIPNIEFKVSPAESLPLQDGAAQLVTVCTAIHWFDIPKFFQEAERVLCKDGVLAAFSHGLLTLRWKKNPSKEAALNKLIDNLVHNTWVNFADTEVYKMVENEYKDIEIPMRDFTRAKPEPGFILERELRLMDIPKYFQSMSPHRRMAAAEGEEAARKVEEKFVQDVLGILGDDADGVDKNDIKLTEEQKYFLIMARK